METQKQMFYQILKNDKNLQLTKQESETITASTSPKDSVFDEIIGNYEQLYCKILKVFSEHCDLKKIKIESVLQKCNSNFVTYEI